MLGLPASRLLRMALGRSPSGAVDGPAQPPTRATTTVGRALADAANTVTAVPV